MMIFLIQTSYFCFDAFRQSELDYLSVFVSIKEDNMYHAFALGERKVMTLLTTRASPGRRDLL